MNRFPMHCRMTIVLCLLIGMTVGCDSSEPSSGSGKPATAKLPDGMLLGAAPTAPIQPIAELKSTAKPGDQVTVKVVIGGRVEPIVSRRAVMTVVDIQQGNKCYGDDDHCPTPWDYCCDSPDLPPHLATVQLIDEQSKPLALNLAAAGFKPGQVLIVRGAVGPRPDPEALIIHATGLFIAAPSPKVEDSDAVTDQD